MRLRNKKTGKIIDSKELLTNEYLIDLFSKDFKYFNSKINNIQEEWEDYEELKEFYWIDYDGEVKTFITSYEWQEKMKELGNYFETKEEAEQAVEKLKAWKRLKDKGFEAVSSSICGSEFVANFKLFDKEDYSQSMDDFDCVLDLRGEE